MSAMPVDEPAPGGGDQAAMPEPCQEVAQIALEKAPKKTFQWSDRARQIELEITKAWRIPTNLMLQPEDFAGANRAMAAIAQSHVEMVHEAARQKMKQMTDRILARLAEMALPPIVIVVETPAKSKLRFLRELACQRRWVSPRLAKRIQAAMKALEAEKELERRIREQIQKIKDKGGRSRVLVLNVEDPQVERTPAGRPVQQVFRLKAPKRPAMSARKQP